MFDALLLDGDYIGDDGSFIRTHTFLLKFIFVFLWNRGSVRDKSFASQLLVDLHQDAKSAIFAL